MLKPGTFLRIGGRSEGSIVVRPYQYFAAIQIERIASAKYDEGNYQRYANGSVVRITRADWEPPSDG
jgi:hypothetical protein